ncbi:MAG TPA: aromatic-ring-hydroxylating dioxygenase subunit beta [Candidatus Binataceae bacterium]|nr:aromatic-ring-hydroxylating dioxygenase subunit beta [Candidatus Binataceae bacterium]
MSDLHDQIESFLFREARLMDEHRYDDWLALWSLEDATYWIPANADDIDPARNVSIVYDRGGQLRNRVRRFNETLWLKERAPRLKRIVGNILIDRENGGEVSVSSNFILTELHRGAQILWAGSTLHLLTASADGFRIKSKKVILLNNNEPLPNMLFLF